RRPHRPAGPPHGPRRRHRRRRQGHRRREDGGDARRRPPRRRVAGPARRDGGAGARALGAHPMIERAGGGVPFPPRGGEGDRGGAGAIRKGWLALRGGGEFSFGETLAADRAWLAKAAPGPIGFVPAASGSADYGRHLAAYFGETFGRELETIPIYRGRD